MSLANPLIPVPKPDTEPKFLLAEVFGLVSPVIGLDGRLIFAKGEGKKGGIRGVIREGFGTNSLNGKSLGFSVANLSNERLLLGRHLTACQNKPEKALKTLKTPKSRPEIWIEAPASAVDTRAPVKLNTSSKTTPGYVKIDSEFFQALTQNITQQNLNLLEPRHHKRVAIVAASYIRRVQATSDGVYRPRFLLVAGQQMRDLPPAVYVHFVRATVVAELLSLDYRRFIEAQFECFPRRGPFRYPEPFMLYNTGAIHRWRRYRKELLIKAASKEATDPTSRLRMEEKRLRIMAKFYGVDPDEILVSSWRMFSPLFLKSRGLWEKYKKYY